MKLNRKQREKLNNWINHNLDTALFEDDFDELEKIITAYESFPVEKPVKPACENCKHRHTEEATSDRIKN